ncbi:MAG: Fe-S cluster assembly protein SufD [Pseudomonadota bacterium]
MSAVLSSFPDDQAAVANAVPVADWAAAVRGRGLARFEASGLPTTRDEDWKYTNVRAIGRGAFQPWAALPIAAPTDEQLAAVTIDGLDAWHIVFVDGHPAPSLCALPEQDGLLCMSLRERLRATDDAALPELLDYGSDGFGALNTAFLGDGVYLETQPDVRLDKPLRLLFLSTAGDTPRAVHPRVVVRAGRHSRLTLIEHYAGLDGAAGLTNAVTQLRLDEGARVDHYRLQEESERAYHVASVDADLAGSSHLSSHNVQLGGRLSRAHVHARLNAAGAHVGLYGFYLAAGRQHTDTHTLVDHLVPRTSSDEEYRGVLTGHGRAVWNGKAVVHEGAAGTDAQQANHNLLLSKSAEIDTKPELEIYTDEVTCSHGATVGALDEEALFYLRSRGLDETAARAMLTFAFADTVLRRLELDALRERVEKKVLKRLPSSETLQGLA